MPSARPAARADRATDSTITVLVAGVANLAIAVAKAVGGVLSGSAAMQAEAAHSLADTVTEALLFVATRRGRRPPDPRHPFGHGRETYLWAFVGALATFVAGAGFSLARGVETLLYGEQPDPGGALVAYGVVAVAFVLEATSLVRGVWQARGMAAQARLGPRAFMRVTSDTPVKAVIFEDSAALVGLVTAAGGLALWQLTGQALWDGLASLAIGVLLVVVAVSLARANLSLVTGQAAGEQLQAALRAELESLDGVAAVPLFVAVVLGPGDFLVAAKVHFAAESSAADIERVADEAERRLQARFPGVRYVFLDPTSSAPGPRR